MTLHIIREEEKLAEVERIVRSMKGFKLHYDARRQIDVMVDIAKDIRARMNGSAPKAIEELERSLALIEASRNKFGAYDNAALVRFAQDAIGFWPEIKAALIDQRGREP